MSRRSRRSTCSIMMTCCSIGRELMQVPELASDIGALFDHVLVDEYQDTNAIQASILLALKPDGKADRRRRRRPVDLRLPRGDGPQHSRLPEQFTPPAAIVTLDQNYRSTAPILDCGQRRDRSRHGRFTKNLCSDRRSAEKPSLVAVRDDAAQAGFVVERVLANREDGVR